MSQKQHKPNKFKIGQGPGAGAAGSKPAASTVSGKDTLAAIDEALNATYETRAQREQRLHEERKRRIADVCGC